MESSINTALVAIEKGGTELRRKDLWLLLKKPKSRVGREGVADVVKQGRISG